MIELSKEYLINQGAYRAVYNHPNDSAKIIKININNFEGNERELKSYKKFNEYTKNFIPKLFGKIETNLGTGLVFEKIYDYDTGLASDKLFDYINKNKDDALKFKIFILNEVSEMFNAFANNLLFTTSFGLENILIQKVAKEEIKILTIDFKIQKHKELIPITKIPFFLKIKIKRRGRRLIKMISDKIENIEIVKK